MMTNRNERGQRSPERNLRIYMAKYLDMKKLSYNDISKLPWDKQNQLFIEFSLAREYLDYYINYLELNFCRIYIRELGITESMIKLASYSFWTSEWDSIVNQAQSDTIILKTNLILGNDKPSSIEEFNIPFEFFKNICGLVKEYVLTALFQEYLFKIEEGEYLYSTYLEKYNSTLEDLDLVVSRFRVFPNYSDSIPTYPL